MTRSARYISNVLYNNFHHDNSNTRDGNRMTKISISYNYY